MQRRRKRKRKVVSLNYTKTFAKCTSFLSRVSSVLKTEMTDMEVDMARLSYGRSSDIQGSSVLYKVQLIFPVKFVVVASVNSC